MLSTLRVGLKIALADNLEDVLAQTGKEVAAIAGDANVLVIPTDVSKIGDVQRLRDKVYEAWGEVSSFRHMAIGSSHTLLFFNLSGRRSVKQCRHLSRKQVLGIAWELAKHLRGQPFRVCPFSPSSETRFPIRFLFQSRQRTANLCARTSESSHTISDVRITIVTSRCYTKKTRPWLLTPVPSKESPILRGSPSFQV